MKQQRCLFFSSVLTTIVERGACNNENPEIFIMEKCLLKTVRLGTVGILTNSWRQCVFNHQGCDGFELLETSVVKSIEKQVFLT